MTRYNAMNSDIDDCAETHAQMNKQKRKMHPTMHKPTYRSCFSFKLISLLRERKLWSALPTTVSVSSLLILTVTSASISFSVLGSLLIIAMAQWRQINVVKRLAVLPTAFCSDHSDGGDAISLKKKKKQC